MCRRNPIHCILPPHILENVAANGTEPQKQLARRSLIVSEQIRGMRFVTSQILVATATGEKQRSIYTASNSLTLPGTLVRSEGQEVPSGDAAVDEAYDGLGDTYDFYSDEYARNSLDDSGMRLVGTVNYSQDYDNAFWDGRQMVFGDGDGSLFNRFTRSLDVIGHELTHGVVEHTANLVYWDEPGALNESFADVFGSLVKQRKLGQDAGAADWLIGAELLAPSVNGRALRSLAAPGTAYDDAVLGKDPQPAHMNDFVQTNDDNGGVHINSGIPNHAFYLAATALGGYASKKAGRIWYVALRDRIRRKTGFQEAANHIYSVAGELFGSGSLEQKAIREAWKAVGLQPEVMVKVEKIVDDAGVPAGEPAYK
jgi:Zn-dependent metalloprotease